MNKKRLEEEGLAMKNFAQEIIDTAANNLIYELAEKVANKSLPEAEDDEQVEKDYNERMEDDTNRLAIVNYISGVSTINSSNKDKSFDPIAEEKAQRVFNFVNTKLAIASGYSNTSRTSKVRGPLQSHKRSFK